MALDRSRRDQYKTKVVEGFPDKIVMPRFTKQLSLRYGQNPGSPAAFYIEEGATGPNMANFDVLQEGKGLGFINVGDMDLGQRVVKTLHDIYTGNGGGVACCIVKHEMPSGVALGKDAYDAFNKAWGSDPLSSFGGVHVFSAGVDDGLARLLVERERNAEVVYAPAFTEDALVVLTERKSLRVVQMSDITEDAIDNGIEYKRVSGGLLVEKRFSTRIRSWEDVRCISEREPTEEEMKAAIFNWIVASYTRSNAVVIGTGDKTHGIGSGQRSRIDAAEQAIHFANGRGGKNESYGSKGTFMASDAYMPQTDVVEAAAEAGVTGIIFPLGSIRDQEVIDAGNERGLALIATGAPGETSDERCFFHR
ncbi:MAG: hypothetical protein IIA87_00965 [Nanoarchaeota archaeon]|nr:hypothetical protein [Nanoarchaeota archaeon]